MPCEQSRRQFLWSTLAGGAAAVAATRWAHAGLAGRPVATRPAAQAAPAAAAAAPVVKPKVALTAGNDRADIAFQSLKALEKEIVAAIGNKRIIIKPNNVVAGTKLACTDASNLEGILEFLKSIKKLDSTIIAESGAGGSTLDGFAGLGYNPVAAKYNVKLVDLDTDEFELAGCIDQSDMRPRVCRVSKMLQDPSSFVISAAKTKTHDTVVATLSLKNIVLAAPLKVNRRSDKRVVHGGGHWAINVNIASLAGRLHPHLAVIDGYEGMEGNGPVGGTPVDHKVCVAGLDWLAADRVGLELMGIDPAVVGYLQYCSQMGMGQFDLERIEIVGPAVKDHIKKYRLSTSIEQQLRWKTPPAPSARG